MNEFLLWSGIDWLVAQEIAECLKAVHDMITAIQLKKLTAGKFFSEWLKCKVPLHCKSLNKSSSLALAMLHAMEHKETTLLSSVAFLAAIYAVSRYQVLLKYFHKTIAQADLAALWRCLQILQESANATDVKCLGSSSESENGYIPAGDVDIIDEIHATLDECSAS